MYEWTTRIRYSEIDSTGKLTIPAMVNLFQDCVNFESEEIGMGMLWLNENGMSWIILNWQIEVERMPGMGERIVVATCPYYVKSTFGYRGFQISTPEGELLARADSMWMLIDWETKKPKKITPEMEKYYVSEEWVPMDSNLRGKILLGENKKKEKGFVIGREHLDTNNHVNNAQYIAFCLSYIPEGRKISKMRIQYRKQAFLGDELIPYVSEDENGLTIALCGADEEMYTAMYFLPEDRE